jgi:hypothetical protein
VGQQVDKSRDPFKDNDRSYQVCQNMWDAFAEIAECAPTSYSEHKAKVFHVEHFFTFALRKKEADSRICSTWNTFVTKF